MGSIGQRAEQIKREQIKHIRIVELQKSDRFKEACDAAGVKPTRRQAWKYLNRQGLAWKSHQRLSEARGRRKPFEKISFRALASPQRT